MQEESKTLPAATPEQKIAELSWDMFELVDTLGNGAFGKVYKVKCLQSTRISDNGN